MVTGYDYNKNDVNRLAKDVSYRNNVVVHVWKDFRKFGCTEEYARELRRVVSDYF